MRVRLTAATDVATFIIFDPAAIQPGDIDPEEPFDAVERLTASGKAICYSYASDGEADFLVLVGEEPDPELATRQQNRIEGALLRVPSGRLVATGLEDLCSRSYDPDNFEPQMGETATITLGTYVVEAFEVDWGELVEEKIAERTSSGDRAFETIIGTSMGCVLFTTFLVLPAVLGIIWAAKGFGVVLEVVTYVLAFHLVFWSITIPLGVCSKRFRRVTDARNEVQEEHPGVVLVLRPLAAGDKQKEFHAGKFGDGFTR